MLYSFTTVLKYCELSCYKASFYLLSAVRITPCIIWYAVKCKPNLTKCRFVAKSPYQLINFELRPMSDSHNPALGVGDTRQTYPAAANCDPFTPGSGKSGFTV